MVLTKGEVRSWWASDVSRNFFDRIRSKIEDLDEDVHKLLLARDEKAAVIPNAEMLRLKEVLEIKNDMIEEAEGE